MRWVWALTSGSYSDYRVCAVFQTERDAKRALDEAKNAPVDCYSRPDSVTSLAIYAEGEMPSLVTVYKRQVVIWDTGEVDGRNPFGFLRNDSLATDQPRFGDDRLWDWSGEVPRDNRPTVRFVRAPIYMGKGGRLEVSGTDEQAVLQSYSDNVARIRLNAETTGKATM